jgi:hypothetical protein
MQMTGTKGNPMTTTHKKAPDGTRTVAERMGEAATNWLASLNAGQRTKAVLAFEDQEKRTSWYYTPTDRDGLPLAEMDRRQQRLAHQLAATGLSRAGYVAASTIMGLEATLDAIEGWHRSSRGRDPGLYYLSLFLPADGSGPGAKEPWGWRFEGHHISLNYTIAGGRLVSPTPTFFGANPAEAPLGATSTLRPLGNVEDLARELAHALEPEQRARAIVSSLAPADIVLANRSFVPTSTDADEGGLQSSVQEAVRYTPTPKGLAAGAMANAQREILMALIGEYIHRMPDELAEIEAAALHRRGLGGIHFAWAGGLERHQGHYYRIQGPRFLVEYDNTQNEANHVHSVWRDPANDFGAHVLAEHYARAHRHSTG